MTFVQTLLPQLLTSKTGLHGLVHHPQEHSIKFSIAESPTLHICKLLDPNVVFLFAKRLLETLATKVVLQVC